MTNDEDPEITELQALEEFEDTLNALQTKELNVIMIHPGGDVEKMFKLVIKLARFGHEVKQRMKGLA